MRLCRLGRLGILALLLASLGELRPATVEGYRDHLDRYLVRLRRRAVADITRQDCRELLDAITRRHGRTAATSGLRTLRLATHCT